MITPFTKSFNSIINTYYNETSSCEAAEAARAVMLDAYRKAAAVLPIQDRPLIFSSQIKIVHVKRHVASVSAVIHESLASANVIFYF